MESPERIFKNLTGFFLGRRVDVREVAPNLSIVFTGIIETMARVAEVRSSPETQNRTFWLQAPLAQELRVDQSVAHDGVCLTVEEIQAPDLYRVTAIAETLDKTNLGTWTSERRVNLERSLRADARLDGHFVQGHTDLVGTVERIDERGGSWDFRIGYGAADPGLIVPRGSIAVNGISLTVAQLFDAERAFQVSIIPYTHAHTNMGSLAVGDAVNLEFDILGKYVRRLHNPS